MSKRGTLRFDEATFQRLATKRERWQSTTAIVNAQPVELAKTEQGVEPVPVMQPYRLMGAPKPNERPYYNLLVALLNPHGVPEPRCEWRFDAVRRWRFDFAWPGPKIAIEIDGGLFVNGGHNRGAYLLQTYEKCNAAQVAGWRVLHYAPHQLAEAARDVLQLMNR